jgi:monoamine oxidase
VRAVVVGAGFAGLAAADELRRGGVDVVVLEARNRVGGRVWSRELPSGSLVEMGAEFVLPGNTVLTGLAERFRLGFWRKGMRYGDREARGGLPVDRATLLAAAQRIRDALAARPPGAPSTSAARLLDSLDLDPGAREAIRARVEVSSANLATEVDAGALADIAAQAEDECPSLAGGNQRLASALAQELGAAVHLSSPVERVVWGDGGVRVRAAGGEVVADAAVLAIPASVIGAVEFLPSLPEPLASAIGGVSYGHAAKLFVPLASAPAPSAVLSVPERYWTWTATAAGGAVQPVVHAFAGSAPALERLRVEEGPETWLGSVHRLRPDLELDPGGAVLSTWDDDPWARAAYSTRGTAPAAHVLARPVGPLHFCGEHTAGELAALMEGALASGQRAARDVLSRLLSPLPGSGRAC